MRTTITLEEDVAQQVKRLARERGDSFKEVINSLLRSAMKMEAQPKPYRIKPVAMGMRPGVNLDKALQLAGQLEDEEILRKMSLGK